MPQRVPLLGSFLRGERASRRKGGIGEENQKIPAAFGDAHFRHCLRGGLLFGSFAILFFPILFAIIGAITGGLGAVIYNVSARYVGGIAVEVE